MDKTSFVSEAEIQRLSLFRAQSVRAARAKKWSRFGESLSEAVRTLLFFLLGAAIVASIVSYRDQIDAAAIQRAGRMVARVEIKLKSDPLRQSALNYEKEVDAATGR